MDDKRLKQIGAQAGALLEMMAPEEAVKMFADFGRMIKEAHFAKLSTEAFIDAVLVELYEFLPDDDDDNGTD